MYRILILVLCLCLASLPALAAENAPADQDAADTEKQSEPLPPPADEYDHVPSGFMLLPDEQTQGSSPGTTGKSVMTESRADFSEILQLYKQGNFDAAAKNIEPLANNGHHGSEELLGIMYRLGQGVPKDLIKARALLSKSADFGRPLAQHHLALMHFLGEISDPPDLVQALMWLHIAISHYQESPEKERAKQDRNNLALRLTRREKDHALQMAHDWLEKQGEAHLLDTPE